MAIKRFKEFKTNEGIDSEELNPEQKSALQELRDSDVSLFDENDFQHYADKIGVSLEDVMEFVSDGGTSTDKMEETEVDSEIEKIVQRELVDNPDVNSGNLLTKIQEIVDRLEEEDYYEWGDEEFDEFLDRYRTLNDTIRNVYNELTGVNNPNQMSMKFESIKKFNDFINEDSDMIPGAIGKKKFKVTGYRTWDEARPEGIIEADSQESIEQNFKSFEDILKLQDNKFDGADLESIEEIPNNI